MLESSRSNKRYMMAQRMTYGLLAIILFIYGLIAVKSFLVPIAFGFLLAYLLFPLADWLERKKIPRILANLITILAATIVLAGVFVVIYQRISIIANDFPHIAREGVVNLSEMTSNLGQYLGFDKEETRTFIQKETSIILESWSRYFSTIFSATTTTVVTMGLLPVFVFMFLYYRTKFMYFILKTVNRETRPKVVNILRQISTVMVRYMAGVIMVVFILAVINSFGLHLIGMRYAIALGIISALFNLIPYFGTLLGGLVPFLFALLVQGDMLMAFRVVLLFIVIQFIENNILTPNIVGGNVRISPFFIITGLFGASMVWGIPGMLLIVPFLAVLRIIFSHLDSMRPYAYLLGDEGTRRHAISKENFLAKWNMIFKKKKHK